LDNPKKIQKYCNPARGIQRKEDGERTFLKFSTDLHQFKNIDGACFISQKNEKLIRGAHARI